jgi:hypothetical protein
VGSGTTVSNLRQEAGHQVLDVKTAAGEIFTLYVNNDTKLPVKVTSAGYNGAFGGLADADAICATHAANAGHSGTFVAYLSTSTDNAIKRIQDARGWVRTDGLPVADLPSDITNGRLFYPIRLDENKADVGAALVWTGSGTTGVHDVSCNDWTINSGPSGAYGQADANSAPFTNFGMMGCAGVNRPKERG